MVLGYYFIDGKNNKVYEDEDPSALIRVIKDRIDDDVIVAMGKDWYDDQDVEDNLDSFYDYLKDPIVYGFGKNYKEENEVTYTAKYSYTFGVEKLGDDDDDEDEYLVYTYDDYMRDRWDINHLNLNHDDDTW